MVKRSGSEEDFFWGSVGTRTVHSAEDYQTLLEASEVGSWVEGRGPIAFQDV